MQKLSANGQQIIDDIARRHGFSADAVLSMLESVINGNGSMAQFNHPEFSGSGQWMSGGMTMVSDMFNNYLKSRVDGLCSELARVVANQPDLLRSGSFQSQSQGGQQQDNYAGGQQQNNYGGGQPGQNGNAGVSLFVPPAPGQSADWWPSDLRWPNSTGAQNNVQYAYFSQARRLVIKVNGQLTVYDTLDHQIGGFSQQQSYGGTLSFSSQYGLIDVGALPVVSIDGVAPAARQAGDADNAPAYVAPYMPPAVPENTIPPQADPASNPFSAPPAPMPAPAGAVDLFVALEKLAELHGRGILSEDEFSAKKTELLARL
ncbi:MAG: SHOCT domain-containing protein [Burkholderiaceae bacterium]|nr:SHOCT domain-containing protein [Burkholderiaceae bacterium]